MIPNFAPPEITLTEVPAEVRRRFTDENANMNSVLLGQMRPPVDDSIRFIEITADWRGPSFKTLAIDDPMTLIALVAKEHLAEHDLTFAAEALGSLADVSTAMKLLTGLARHSSAVVREGAVYGLSRHLSNSTAVSAARIALVRLSKDDPSPGVREAATEALDA